jgi:hypothetical protein
VRRKSQRKKTKDAGRKCALAATGRNEDSVATRERPSFTIAGPDGTELLFAFRFVESKSKSEAETWKAIREGSHVCGDDADLPDYRPFVSDDIPFRGAVIQPLPPRNGRECFAQLTWQAAEIIYAANYAIDGRERLPFEPVDSWSVATAAGYGCFESMTGAKYGLSIVSRDRIRTVFLACADRSLLAEIMPRVVGRRSRAVGLPADCRVESRSLRKLQALTDAGERVQLEISGVEQALEALATLRNYLDEHKGLADSTSHLRGLIPGLSLTC